MKNQLNPSALSELKAGAIREAYSGEEKSITEDIY